MVLKITKLKKSLKRIIKDYYLVIIATVVILVFFILGINFIISLHKKGQPSFQEKFVIISFNKVLYIDKNVKHPDISEAIKSYESGFVEKAKFLFNAALQKSKHPDVKKVAYVNLANIFDDNGDYELAIEYLKKANTLAPRDGIIYHNMGIVYKHLKDNKNSILAFEKAIHYNRKFVKSYLSLASLYFYMNDFKRSYKYYEKASKLNPRLYEALYNAAICQFKMNHFEKGIEQLEKIMNSQSVTPKVRAESAKILGTHYTGKGDHEKGLYYFKKASEIYQDFDLYYRTGVLYTLMGNYQQAMESFKKAYLLNENDLDTIRQLAELYYRFGDYDGSLKYYKYLLDTQKVKSEVLLTMGEIYYKKGQYADAVEYYKKALDVSLTPDQSKIVHVNLGNLYSTMNDYDNALEHYQKALELDNLDINVYYNMGVLNLNSKKYLLALENFKKALEIAPSNLRIHLLLARTYLAMNERDKAIVAYSHMIEKFPKEVTVYFELATLYYKLTKYDQARHYYEKIINMDPEKDILYKVYLNLGVILNNEKKYQQALEMLKQAYSLNQNDPYINYNTGIVHLNNNNIDMAKDYLKKTLRLKSDDRLKALVHLALGNCYYYLKDNKQAKSEYDIALKYDPKLTEAYFNLKVVKNSYETP